MTHNVKRFLYPAMVLNAFFVAVLLRREFYTPDTPCYVRGARLFFGLPGGEDCDFRILKPLPLIFPGLLEKATGIEAQYGFLIQNLIFYFLTCLLIFEIIRMVFKDEWQAFWGGLIFITAPPLLLYGLAYQTDMPGWFFEIMGIYATLRLFDKLTERALSPLFIGFILGIGFLWKESALAGVVFFSVYILITELPAKQKWALWLYAALGFLIPVLVSSVIVYHYSHYTFWSWYRYQSSKPLGDDYHVVRFIQEAVRTFHVSWILLVVGLFRFLRVYLQDQIDADEMRFLIASGATLLLWPIWPYPSNRIFYLSAPFLAGVASYGTRVFGEKRGSILVVLAGVFNFAVMALWSAFGTRGLVYVLGVIFSAIMIWWAKAKPQGSIEVSIKCMGGRR